MALNFPIPTSVGQVYQDPTSGNTYVCTSLGPPAQWVGSGSSTSLDSTYLRKDASNDPVTGNLILEPTTNVNSLLVKQTAGNTTPAIRVENSGTGNSIEVDSVFSVSSGGVVSVNNALNVSGTATFSTTGAMTIPVGTIAERPGSPVVGMSRWNSSFNDFEIWDGTGWRSFIGSQATADRAIFGYGFTSVNVSMTNLVSNTGVVASDTTGVGAARYHLAAAGYGGDKAIFGYGFISVSGGLSMTNLVSNTGVVASDTTGVGTARRVLAAAGYGA